MTFCIRNSSYVLVKHENEMLKINIGIIERHKTRPAGNCGVVAISTQNKLI